MAFQIPLAEQKVKPHQVTALHLVTGFALLAFSAIALLVNNSMATMGEPAFLAAQQAKIEQFDSIDLASTLIMVISIIILLSALFRNKWLRQPHINKIYRVVELVLLAAVAVFLLTITYNIPAAIFGVLAATIVFSLFWETNKGVSLSVHINERGIDLPVTSRRRHINWTEVDNVILRHGTITINCADGRMHQWVTAQHSLDADGLEAFSHAHIEAKKKDREKDW